MKNGSLEDGETDIYTFVCKLRQEKLFIKSEKIHIQELNELIKKKTQAVIKSSWLTNKQRLLLLERRVSSQNCQHFDFVHNSEFVEAKNTSLGFQNAVKISNLLHILRSQPKQLANWLITGETITEDNIEYPLILQSLLNGLYGGCLFAEDTKLVLTLLFELAKKQLIKSDNPRRIIKHRSCSFKHLYFLFHEIYQPAKFFLSAALEMPILEVLSFSDYFLDIDHDKTIMRFRQEDSLKMYKDAVEYRNDVASKLAQFINSFIQSLLENVCSFPKAMAWISCHIYKMIEKSFCAKEANAIITELLFTFFICPVILDPEQYGISNSSTSEMARHNLIEIGKILQLLALYKFEGIDKKYMDIFENVDKNSMSNFVELLFFDMDSNEPPVETTPEIVRDIMLFTDEELNNLICFLQKVQMMRIANDNIEKNPSLSVSIEEHLSSLTVPSRDNSPKTSRPNGEVSDYNSTNNVGKKTAFFSLGSLGTHKNNHHSNNSRRSTEEEPKNHAKNTVIVFPIDGVITEPVGLLPEDKVIDLSVPVKNDSGVFEASSDIVTCKDNMMETSVVSTRGDIKGGYSGYADEGSIGNTSDNLEAISEAASNHSVASSLELENEDQNDNLSDMVSANVSGRGTPNISGRDTPSSQVNENEDRAHVDPAQPPGDHVDAGVRQQQLPQSPPTVNISERQRRSEIDDKFCKFEIQRLLEGDETVSIISETWSTDVLSSDTETVEGDPRNDRHQHLPHLVDQAIQEVPMENVLDISETQSEGAWSTDVMASDTERLTEVDNDDAASVAQSDDTNSVARSDDTRSETDEAASARRLSSCSSSYGGISGGGAVANTTYAPPSGNSPSYVSTSNSMFLSHTTSTSSSYKSTTDANFVTINQTYVTGTSYQEFKKRDSRINGKINSEIDSNANNVFKPLSPTTQTNQEQFDCVTDPATPSLKPEKTDDMNFLAGPSGLNGKPLLDFDSEQSFIKPTTAMKNYGDRPTEILLSNCSLNSSSSGSSSNSFENKAPTTENPDQWEPKPWLNSSGSSLNVTLTPSESTSELSVMSVNSHLTSNVINPTGAIKKTLKPSASTGAIPKSISFDMSVDKGLDDDSRSKRGGFFGRLRKGFGYKKRPFRNQEEIRNGDGYDYLVKRGVVDSPVRNNNTLDTSEDILAKYRKPLSENSPIKENGTVKKLAKTSNDDNLNSDTNSFADIKKKLRLVLGNTSEIPYYIKHNPCTIKLKLETILRLELGKARKLRDGSAAARVAEALRCVKQLEERRCVKLIESLRADLMVRAAYLRYLVDSKQELLFAQMYLSSLHDQIKQDRLQCEVYFASVCVREFLNEQEQLVLSFCDEFRRLNLADEKCDFLQNFLKKLFEVMHENKHWKDVLHKRDFLIKFTLERCIVSRVYFNAIYPNGDGDRDRDRVLHDHISTLSKTLHPDHKDLLIPSVYLREMPWLPAQEALRALDAARAPRDKIRCVSRCAKCLVDLLGLSGSCAAADDFTPVLVFVIIKVNPVALLSTIQFVNSFHASQIKGEDEYWWTQFCSAVEYIKTMDYSD